MEGSRSAANNADTAYQEMVKNLEEARQLWDREMELLCKVGRRRVEQSERRGKTGMGREGKVGGQHLTCSQNCKRIVDMYHFSLAFCLIQQFQGLEEQRIAFLRHQMWTYCNLCSQATVSEDEVRGEERRREGGGWRGGGGEGGEEEGGEGEGEGGEEERERVERREL